MDADIDADRAAVAAANQAFYDAFEAGSKEALFEIWEHSDRAQCTHPGWPILRGWDDVGASWAAIIDGPQQLQFVLTNERVEVEGDVGWVTVDENLLSNMGGGTVSAVNVFTRMADGWKMVSHHGSSVLPDLRR